MPPKGKPTSSTERMRAKRARELGLAPPLKTCSVCGKQLKEGSGSGKAYAAGLCWEHWRESQAGKVERRRQNLRSDVWAAAYIVSCTDKTAAIYFPNARAAISAAKNAGKDCIIAVCWSNGDVTVHPGLTSKNCAGLTPDDGDPVLSEDIDWFHKNVPVKKRTWFEA